MAGSVLALGVDKNATLDSVEEEEDVADVHVVGTPGLQPP